ncbi:MAG: hypothetical protein OXC09_07195 [Truepera sp.]|nr:hypothetical protein [Truepera sp.]
MRRVDISTLLFPLVATQVNRSGRPLVTCAALAMDEHLRAIEAFDERATCSSASVKGDEAVTGRVVAGCTVQVCCR